MTEILASLLINVLLRKGFEKVEEPPHNVVVYGGGPPYEYSHLGQSWAKETG